MNWSLVQVQPKDETVPALGDAERCPSYWLEALTFLSYEQDSQLPLSAKLAFPLRLLLSGNFPGTVALEMASPGS